MKKSTKVLLVLAAIVAMTIGAVSTVMAADDVNAAVIDINTWVKHDNDTWTAKDVNGRDIKSGWAVNSAGQWFYFKNGFAVANEFVYWRNNWYYFGRDAIMATGWVKFTPSNANPIIGDLGIRETAGKPVLDGTQTSYGKSVWCYFKSDGTVASNEWICVDGLWYYFEGPIMIASTYKYEIDNVTYGFSGDGNMLVGWIPIKNVLNINNAGTPFEDTTGGQTIGWAYYMPNGRMVDRGWERVALDGKWYYFVENTADSRFERQGGAEAGVMIALQSTFIKDNNNKTYYLGPNGDMQTGEVTIGNRQGYYVGDEDDENNNNDSVFAKYMAGTITGTNYNFAIDILFNDNGTQVINEQKNDRYYGTGNVYKVNGTKKADRTLFTVAYPTSKTGIAGEKISNAIYYKAADKIYYYDASGMMMKNNVLDLGITVSNYSIGLAFGSNGMLIQEKGAYRQTVAGTLYYFNEEFGQATIGAARTLVNCCSRGKQPTMYDIKIAGGSGSLNVGTNTQNIQSTKAPLGEDVVVVCKMPNPHIRLLDANNRDITDNFNITPIDVDMDDIADKYAFEMPDYAVTVEIYTE